MCYQTKLGWAHPKHNEANLLTQVAVKESTVFIIKHQARRKCSWCSKDLNFPKAFRRVLKTMWGTGSQGGWSARTRFFWLIHGEVTRWCFGNLYHQPSDSNPSGFCLLIGSTWLTFSTLLFCVTRNQQMGCYLVNFQEEAKLISLISSQWQSGICVIVFSEHRAMMAEKERKKKQKPRSLPKTPQAAEAWVYTHTHTHTHTERKTLRNKYCEWSSGVLGGNCWLFLEKLSHPLLGSENREMVSRPPSQKHLFPESSTWGIWAADKNSICSKQSK